MVALKRLVVKTSMHPSNRSRNAVVALKLRPAWGSMGAGGLKQERRGGIETVLAWDQRAGHVVKQERRGGIETRQAVFPLVLESAEAGTPWWH